MKKLFLLLLVLPFLASCSSDDVLSQEEQKEKEQKEQMEQQVKNRIIYPLGTHKKDIDFDITHSADTLLRVYARSEMTSGEPINPQTVFCLKNDKINSIMVEYSYHGLHDEQLIFDVSCFDSSIELELNTNNGYVTGLKNDSINGTYNKNLILIRKGFLHSAPKSEAIIIEYSLVN